MKDTNLWNFPYSSEIPQTLETERVFVLIRESPSLAWSCIYGAIAYILFLGVGVVGLIFYNIWNNRELEKARQRQKDERCRDTGV